MIYQFKKPTKRWKILPRSLHPLIAMEPESSAPFPSTWQVGTFLFWAWTDPRYMRFYMILWHLDRVQVEIFLGLHGISGLGMMGFHGILLAFDGWLSIVKHGIISTNFPAKFGGWPMSTLLWCWPALPPYVCWENHQTIPLNDHHCADTSAINHLGIVLSA